MPRKPARLVVVAVAAALALAGADLGLRISARAWLSARLAAYPGLHVAEIEVARLAGAATLRGVVLDAGRTRVTIGALRVPLPGPTLGPAPAEAETAAPPAAAGTIQAEDVAITAGTATIRIKRIDVAGTKLTQADLKTLLDDKAPDGLEARFRKLSATAIVVPEIAVDDATHGAERHALVKKVLLAGVVEGKAASFSAAETSVALTSGDDAVNGATGGIEAANLDLVQLARVLTAKRGDAAEPVHPLFDKAQINAAKLANVTRNAAASAAKITASDVGARPLDQSLVAASAVAAQAGSSAASNALLFDDLTQSVAIGALEVDDAVSQGKAGDEDTRVAAAHIGVRDVGARGIGAVEIRDFKMEGAYARLAVGTASMGPVPIPGKGGGGETRPAARPGQVDLGQIQVDVTPRDQPASQALRFKVEHAALAQDGGPSAIPATGSATIDKLSFEAAPDGMTHALYDMGYRGVSLSAAFSSSYDAGSQELVVRKLAIDGPAMGSAKLELRLAGVSDSLLSPDAETAQAAAIGVAAKAVDLALVDAGLTDKTIALLAKRDGIGVAEERAYYVDLFSDKLPTMLGDGAGVKSLGGALGKFLAAPKSLHISIGSKEGLGIGAIGMLADPGALLDSLDIKASANE